MSTTLPAGTTTTNIVTAPDTDVLVERLILNGDLAALTPAQKTEYYRRYCQRFGLDPLTQPFEYIRLSGRLTLYIKKNATEQLRRKHGVSITKVEHTRHDDLYVVTAYGKLPDGREDSDAGAVAIRNLAGEALANAIMKAITKAKRRLTLSLVGLGLLDESEVEDVVIGGRVRVNHATGEIEEDPGTTDALADSEPGLQPEHQLAFEQLQKDEALSRIKTGFSLYSVDRPAQEKVWREFCGEATFLTAEAPLQDLDKLREHLRAKYAGKGRR